MEHRASSRSVGHPTPPVQYITVSGEACEVPRTVADKTRTRLVTQWKVSMSTLSLDNQRLKLSLSLRHLPNLPLLADESPPLRAFSPTVQYL